jgi:hypothetical protein
VNVVVSSRSTKRAQRFNSLTLPDFIASISYQRKQALSQIVKEIEDAILHDTNIDTNITRHRFTTKLTCTASAISK